MLGKHQKGASAVIVLAVVAVVLLIAGQVYTYRQVTQLQETISSLESQLEDLTQSSSTVVVNNADSASAPPQLVASQEAADQDQQELPSQEDPKGRTSEQIASQIDLNKSELDRFVKERDAIRQELASLDNQAKQILDVQQ